MRKNLVLVTILLLSASLTAEAGLIFSDSRDKTEYRQHYREKDSLGKSVVTIPAYQDTIYTVFVSLASVTHIVMPYTIITPPSLPSTGYDIKFKSGTNYFFITPGTKALQGQEFNMHVTCKNKEGNQEQLYFVRLKIKQVQKGKENRVVTFTDGLDKQDKSVKIAELKRQLQKYKNISSLVQFFDSRKIKIEQALNFEGIKIKLLNITQIDKNLFFNFQIEQESDQFTLDMKKPKTIVLTLRKLSKQFFFDGSSKESQVFFPTDINYYEHSLEAEKNKYFSLMFDVARLEANFAKDLFFGKLKIGEAFEFESKLDFTKTELKQNLFYNPAEGGI